MMKLILANVLGILMIIAAICAIILDKRGEKLSEKFKKVVSGIGGSAAMGIVILGILGVIIIAIIG